MGKEQELLDASRTGNVVVIEKLLCQRFRRSLPLPLPVALAHLRDLASLRRTPNPNCQDTNGDTPLHHASLNGHKEAVKTLLQHEASANVVDSKGCYPLHLSAWSGSAEICDILLTHGPSLAKVNEQNDDGDTALHCAAQYGHTKVVHILLEQRGDPTIRNNKGESALDLASQYGRLEAAQALVRKNPSLLKDVPASTTTTTPLHLASRNGHRHVVQLLLDNGFDINAKTEEGTALHEAALFGKQDVVRLLLDRGIDTSVTDGQGRSALDILSDHKSQLSLEVGKLILEHIESKGNRQVTKRYSRRSGGLYETRGLGVYDILPPPHVIDSNRQGPVFSTSPTSCSTSALHTNLLKYGVRDALHDSRDSINSAKSFASEPTRLPPRISDITQRHSTYETHLPTNPLDPDNPDSPPHPKDHHTSRSPVDLLKPGCNLEKSPSLRSLETPKKPPRRKLKAPNDSSMVKPEHTGSRQNADGASCLNGNNLPENKSDHLEEPASVPTTTTNVKEDIASVTHIVNNNNQTEESVTEVIGDKVNDSSDRTATTDNGVVDKQSGVSEQSKDANENQTNSTTTADCQQVTDLNSLLDNNNKIVRENKADDRHMGSAASYLRKKDKSKDAKITKDKSLKKVDKEKTNDQDEGVLIRVDDDCCHGNKNEVGECQRSPSGSLTPTSRPPSLELSSKRSSQETPLSPTGYEQPPTPDHPPPSPLTAAIGIQEKINPKEKRRSRDMETITEAEYLQEGQKVSNAMTDSQTETDLIEGLTEQPPTEGKTPTQNLASKDVEIVCNKINPFLGLIKGSIPAGQRRVKSQIYDNIIVHPSVKLRKRISAPGLCARFDPLMEREEGDGEAAAAAMIDRRRSYGLAGVDLNLNVDDVGDDVSAGAKKDELFSPLDENEEWAKIAAILSSCGGRMSASEYSEYGYFEKRLQQILAEEKEGKKVQSVGDWLEDLGLRQYENVLVGNGFDDMDFMGPNILEESDLVDMGLCDETHRSQILEASGKLAPLKSIAEEEVPDSVAGWLQRLRLGGYIETFHINNFTTMDRVRNIWELELNSHVLDMTSLGHRKRILASLRVAADPDADSQDGESHQELLQPVTLDGGVEEEDDLCLFKDYTKVTSLVRKSHSQTTSKTPQGDMGVPDELTIRPPNCAHTESPIKQWRHRPEVLIKGCCNYSAQYLGSTVISNLQGIDTTRESINKLKKSSETIAKVPSVILSISYTGVKFIDAHSKRVICEHEISNIFCACQDGDHLNYFAYITKDLQSDRHYCHVFCVRSTDLATEIILTLGEAFEVAYQVAIRERALQSDVIPECSDLCIGSPPSLPLPAAPPTSTLESNC